MRSSTSDDLTLYILIGAIGAIPVSVALWSGRVFTSEDTIGVLMVCGAIAGLATLYRRSRRERQRT